ncbi:MAG: B12-binding domain-containing radical SAM protein [Fimbriimonadaceae bacterium]|nr:B12-binding domain-containing radical SAM protein [Fimbriimonadaceae bacterium]
MSKERSILFLAMSGVRIKDKELLEFGMTLPGFVERGKVIASLPSLGLLTLAALTPEHWRVEYREVDAEIEETVQAILRERFDVVAISSLTARILDAYSIADQLRSEGMTVVLGGLHASVMPSEAANHADSVVVGEGESVWKQVLADFEAGKLQQRYTTLGTTEQRYSFADSPLPRFDLLDINRYNRITIQTTRGCPLDCSFCAASRMISSYKRKPIPRIRREIEAILDRWPKPFIELADDNTFIHRKWSLELVQMIGEYPVRWFTETDIRLADDPELLDALAKSGCAQVLIGLESSAPESLSETDRGGWKRKQLEFYAEKIDRIQSAGISVNGCFILGFDHDDVGVFDRTREFVERLNLSEVQITILTPFPGTALTNRLRDEGRLLKPIYWDECTLFDVTYRPQKMSPDDLRDGFRRLAGEIYSDDATAQRKQSFHSSLRKSKRRVQETINHGSP